MNKKFKTISVSHLPLLNAKGIKCRSDEIHPSSVPSTADPRSYYLEHPTADGISPPLISSSSFVPATLISLLMRRKKDSALGVKFIRKGGYGYWEGQRLDEITNM